MRDDLPIVDAHHHFWDLEGPIRYPWLTDGMPSRHGDHSAFCRTYLPDEYRRDTALHNVIATVHVEAECARDQVVEETRWLIDLHARCGMPNVIVAHAWLDTPDAAEIIDQQSRFPMVRGIRSKPVTAASPHENVRGRPRSMQHDTWLRGLGLLERHGLSWDLRVPWWHLEEAAEVARTYPRLPIALNHTGCPWDRDEASMDGWRRGMHALAANPNVHCKLSGLLVTGQTWTFEANAPVIREAIEIFGVDRCMFASNVPPDTLKGSWDYLVSNYKRAVADFPLQDREKLFSRNALAFYRIERGD